MVASMRVAFVAPFYGPKAAGGAEAECRNTAIRLARSGMEVDIWTTCALDLGHGWQTSYYREGVTQDEGLTVHRYRALPMYMGVFRDLNNRLIEGKTLSRAEEEQFMAMHVSSPGLLRGLAAACDRYQWVCFIPYLFGTACYGTQVCPGKSILIPCLHDEGYARMAVVRDMFRRVKNVVYNAASEKELAGRLYGIPSGKGMVMGIGMDTRFEFSADRFRAKYSISDPFILYAGRKDITKNVHVLIHYFAAYKAARPGPLKLVLIGPGTLPIPPEIRPDVVDLGFIPEQDKKDAYAAATVFCQPSVHESFSIVIMESWVCGVPCLVHGDCTVTREHVVRSGGGLYFRRAAEFGGCLDYLQENRQMAKRMGEAGGSYVRAEFEWEHVIRRYRERVFV